MNRILFVLIAAFLSSNIIQAQSGEEAMNYLKGTTSSLEMFRVETWNLLKSTVKITATEELEWKIKNLAEKVEATRKDLNTNESFYGDNSAKVAMTVYLKTAHQILTEDFKQIKQLERISTDSFESMERYLQAQNKANERLSDAGERLDGELKRFAKRYKIVVTEDKSLISKKIEKASMALGYYNQIYLAFFKVYDQKLKVYSALKSEDLEKIKLEVTLLQDFCNTSLQRLMILDGFMEDVTLNKAAQNIIEQYQYESKEVFPTALRAIERKHIFSMAQEVFNAIPEEEKTQKDVDHVNSLILPLNQAIDKQNEEFSKSESKRESLFSNWNEQILLFFSTYLS